MTADSPIPVQVRLVRHLLGPRVEYCDNPEVSEIMINGPDDICVVGGHAPQRAPHGQHRHLQGPGPP